jgi:hypothetical protein
MDDRSTFTDHRREAAMATGDTDASYRGWDFSNAVDDVPMVIRALAEICRPRSLVIFAVIGAVASVWFW